MKTSIATVSISGEFEEKLSAIARAGFDAIEIFENDFLAFDRSPADVGKMVRDHGLTVSLFQPFRDFEGMPEPFRSRNFDRAERKFDLMAELGTDLMLICSNTSPVSLGGIDRAAADFAELGERAAKRGLRVGYEALAWGRHIHDHRDAWEIVRRADHKNIGLILDSFHTLARKIEVNSIRSIPGDRIFIVQLADAPLIEMDLLYWSRHFRNMPGEGDLPVAAFMQAVAATGYDGFLSLEIFNDQFRGGSPEAISKDGRRSLVYLMDQVKRAEPDIRMPVPVMPARAEVSGIAFIEFAVGENDGQDLEALFSILGFRPVGQHRSKAVTLFRQGDIQLIVNREEKGFANASYLVHGANAYAFGLTVDDAKAAHERALQLGAEDFCQAVGPGEMQVPAIRGVGGGIVYFLDTKSELAKIWDAEFVPIANENSVSDIGLIRIDHLAQTTRYEEMLTWLLFYTSQLATRKTPMVDIIDPAGVVRSQVVETPDGSLRITLNGAENRNTLAGRFIAETFGSGIQHIAFETGDILKTAQALATKGFRSLVISPNYYEDIEARFGLEPSLIERMKSLNILYDKDETGEYFQLYSPTYGEGFFFEIVQRKGYSGYGAPNAIFRIAALRRYLRPQGMPK
ncbi:bifunctional sugar phosphate isomerase/epimerase/4-hydroxyphenylpyruvate dioxygenase family protein [Rhizobium sp. G187]|uniref:bifunctional sugar phosphate isomerase/epimerase/4-hydroxyphenylpyruvate dioxygenase family protein n=1 Tax=Rhizobium sp. G187 TaxID=3451352 RepID=UPI003EE56970